MGKWGVVRPAYGENAEWLLKFPNPCDMGKSHGLRLKKGDKLDKLRGDINASIEKLENFKLGWGSIVVSISFSFTFLIRLNVHKFVFILHKKIQIKLCRTSLNLFTLPCAYFHFTCVSN